MLPRIQTPRLLVLYRLQWQACRTNSTTADTKRHRQESSTFAADQHKLPVLRAPEQSAFVRTARFLEFPVQAFAVIRAVERKYGAVNEYYIAKDFEVETRYQSVIHLQFKDPESFGRLPTNSSDIFHVATPEALNRPGGVGLDELELFLERQEYVEEAPIPAFGSVMDSVLQTGRDEVQNKNVNFMECKITRSKNPFWTPSSSPPPLTSARDMTGRNFIKWGGFQTLKPIKKGTPIPNEELFGPTSLDHVRMRRTLRKWSVLSGAPNPYEYSESPEALPRDHQAMSASIQDGQPQGVVQETQPDFSTWEPLPGYESDPEDTVMPSMLHTTATQARLAGDATPSPIPRTPVPPADVPEVPRPLQKIEHVRKEDFSDLLTSPQVQIPTIDITPQSTLHPATTNNATTPSPHAEKAAQLKAARAAANFNKSPLKKPQRKPLVKGPQPLPKKPRPASPVQEEKKNDGVTAKLRSLFGF